MIKMVALLKRRPGMSRQEFIDYYENHHIKLADPLMRGNAVKYLRRYINPIAHPLATDVPEPPYDVVMEMWFKDSAQHQGAMARFAAPGTAEILGEDEKRVFDTDRTIVFTVDEIESDLSV